MYIRKCDFAQRNDLVSILDCLKLDDALQNAIFRLLPIKMRKGKKCETIVILDRGRRQFLAENQMRPVVESATIAVRTLVPAVWILGCCETSSQRYWRNVKLSRFKVVMAGVACGSVGV